MSKPNYRLKMEDLKMAEATTTPAAQEAAATTGAQQASAENQQQQPATQTAGQAAGGEKTFTQAEVDKIVQDRLARAKTPEPPAAQAAPTAQGTAEQSQLAALQQALVSTEVRAQMGVSGIQPEKVERACRLVDLSKCTNKAGLADIEKIKAEIEALKKDFPELKTTTAEGSAGFKIGADGNAQDKNTLTQAALDEAFGLRPKKES